MATSTLDILLNAKNRASGPLRQVTTDVRGLDRATGLAAKGVAGLTMAFGVVGLAALAKTAFDLARTSAESQRLAASFKLLAQSAGQSGDEMLTAMRRASRGMIDDTSLIMSANRAMVLGVADSAGEMTQLLEVAIARGRAMGLTTQQAFDDLVTGIGRMSPLILDNLGILTGGTKVFEDYALSIGKAADELTDTEKRQALFNKVIADSADMVRQSKEAGDDALAGYERMRAAIANMKDALGTLLIPALIVTTEVLTAATESLTRWAQALADTAEAESLTKWAQELADKIPSAADAAKRSLWDVGRSLTDMAARFQDVQALLQLEMAFGDPAKVQVLRVELARTTQTLISMGENYNRLAEAAGAPLLNIAELHRGIVALADAEQQVAGTTDEANAALERQAATLGRLQAKLAGMRLERIESVTAAAVGAVRGQALALVEVLGIEGALGQFQAWKGEILDSANAMTGVGDSADYVEFALRNIVDRADEFTQSFQNAEKQTAKVRQEFDDLKSKVLSVLRAALDPGVGIDPEQFLPRADAINEDARRLADVAVRGFDSPWYDYLTRKFPGMFETALSASGGNVQQAAASILRDFQEGLRPELLDREKAKERVKRMLLGEANLAALAQDIAHELAGELGGQFSLQQIRSATGLALGTGGADSIATMTEGMVGAVSGENTGGRVVEVVRGQLTASANLLKIRAAGQELGRMWGNGFLEIVGSAVPPALIGILVQLVMPGVFALLDRRTTMTEAEP